MNSRRAYEMGLYTGNDDAIIHDLFTVFEENIDGVVKTETNCQQAFRILGCFDVKSSSV